MSKSGVSSKVGVNFVKLLRPYAGSLGVALFAVVGEGVTGLLDPWPLKIVFDSVSGSKPVPSWLADRLPASFTAGKMAILELAAIAVVAIAILDAASEELVFDAIDKLIEGKTAIVIAHRFSTIRRASLIFVIDDGQIVESGTHEQLLQSKGLYMKLYELQFRQEPIRNEAALSVNT